MDPFSLDVIGVPQVAAQMESMTINEIEDQVNVIHSKMIYG